MTLTPAELIALSGKTRSDAQRRALELNGNLGDALRHALARAQVKGHAFPAPIINGEFDRRVGRLAFFTLQPAFSFAPTVIDRRYISALQHSPHVVSHSRTCR